MAFPNLETPLRSPPERRPTRQTPKSMWEYKPHRLLRLFYLPKLILLFKMFSSTSQKKFRNPHPNMTTLVVFKVLIGHRMLNPFRFLCRCLNRVMFPCPFRHCHLHLVNRAISRFFVHYHLCHSRLSSVVPSATAHIVHISLVVALTFHILTPHIRHFELAAPIRHLFSTLTKGLAIIPLPN